MAELTRAETSVAATPTEIREILRDPVAIQHLLPDAESFEAIEPGHYRAVLAQRVRVFTVRADVDARVLDVEPPGRLRLEIEGRPRGFGGLFNVTVPFELEEDAASASGPRTRIRYSVDLEASGAAAGFAGPAIGSALPGLVANMVNALEIEARARRQPG